MTRIQKHDYKTSFKSPDEIVSHLIQNEELVAVCPANITVEPLPKEVTETRDSTGKKKSNVWIFIIIAVLGVILASAFPELLHHGIELIIMIILLPILFFAFVMGLRVRPNAFILTADNAWVIYGVSYDKKTNCYNYNISLCIPRAEVKKHSWSATLRTLKLQIPGGYEVRVAQAKNANKTKYYKEKVVDLAEIDRMLP